MDMTKFDAVLSVDDKDFIKKFRVALGLKPGEKVSVTTPKFHRTDGRYITYFPNTPTEYEALPRLSRENLIKIGCSIWETVGGQIHWLYPGEWYEVIPDGTEIVDISGRRKEFVNGNSSDDIRGGCLAYGFIQQVEG